MKILKFKDLTKEKIIISIDRLTRFKNPQIKYKRVFTDILTTCLIEPKLKKSEIENLSPLDLKNIAVLILNHSIDNISNTGDENYIINQKLLEYENLTFIISKETEILLDNKIKYNKCLDLINNTSPKNLLWLKELCNNTNIIECRKNLALKFPITKVILVEGITEEILLPKFSQIYNFDFNKEGIYIISAGGKNQVVKLYYELVEQLKIPIFVLLDNDAVENCIQIQQKLRQKDKLHKIKSGEFEDLLPLNLIKKTLNYELNNISMLEQNTLEKDLPKVKILEEIFKTRGLHEFKKADFAQSVNINITDINDISEEIKEIFDEIKKLN